MGVPLISLQTELGLVALSLSLQRSLQRDWCFVLAFPVCTIEKGKEEEDCVWLLGGQSTESLTGPLLFKLSWLSERHYVSRLS